MLKTNSKQARANIQAYIVRNFDGSSYDITAETFPEVAAAVLRIFRAEKAQADYYRAAPEEARFADWAAGLPSVLDTCYYYNRSAVDDLGAILEETDREKARYTEQQAEALLTDLIYRELLRGCKYGSR